MPWCRIGDRVRTKVRVPDSKFNNKTGEVKEVVRPGVYGVQLDGSEKVLPFDGEELVLLPEAPEHPKMTPLDVLDRGRHLDLQDTTYYVTAERRNDEVHVSGGLYGEQAYILARELDATPGWFHVRVHRSTHEIDYGWRW